MVDILYILGGMHFAPLHQVAFLVLVFFIVKRGVNLSEIWRLNRVFEKQSGIHAEGRFRQLLLHFLKRVFFVRRSEVLQGAVIVLKGSSGGGSAEHQLGQFFQRGTHLDKLKKSFVNKNHNRIGVVEYNVFEGSAALQESKEDKHPAIGH